MTRLILLWIALLCASAATVSELGIEILSLGFNSVQHFPDNHLYLRKLTTKFAEFESTADYNSNEWTGLCSLLSYDETFCSLHMAVNIAFIHLAPSLNDNSTQTMTGVSNLLSTIAHG